jgi:hypothetical protein
MVAVKLECVVLQAVSKGFFCDGLPLFATRVPTACVIWEIVKNELKSIA